MIFFQQLTTPMAGNFSLDWLKFCCFTSILKVITFSSSTWHTFSLLIFVKCCLQTIFLQKQRRILQNREFSFFFLLSVSESITKVFCLFTALKFTSSESELYSEELSSSKTLLYTLLRPSEKVSADIHWKFFFTQCFRSCHFWKCHGNKLAFIMWLSW